MSYFAWLLSISLSLARYAWPVTLLLFAALAVSLYAQLRRPSRLTVVPWARIAIGFAFPPLILLCGTLWHAGPRWTPRPGANIVVWAMFGLLVLHILTAALTVRQAAGARWVAATVSACQVWWSIGSLFVAGMSVTGDWL